MEPLNFDQDFREEEAIARQMMMVYRSHMRSSLQGKTHQKRMSLNNKMMSMVV
jgi:hypothetical protein